MSLRFASLGSGSEGNAMLVEAGSGATRTRLLLDCGFGISELTTRLAARGLSPGDLSALVITHEHGDHIGCAYAFAARHRLPLYLSHGTATATQARAAGRDVDLRCCAADQSFTVGELLVEPYTVPHDAREPLQYVFSDGARRLGVLTDIGMSTPHVISRLRGVHALVLECNHDQEMLRRSVYPAALKARIAGDFGHLSNDAAAQILAAVRHDGLRTVVAAHLSQQNNTPELAAVALSSALGAGPDDIIVAAQASGCDWLQA